jgi:hypothetical protein
MEGKIPDLYDHLAAGMREKLPGRALASCSEPETDAANLLSIPRPYGKRRIKRGVVPIAETEPPDLNVRRALSYDEIND